MSSLNDITNVLEVYKDQFGCLDVFADNVAEIAQQRAIFEKLGVDLFRIQVAGRNLELQMFRDKNVARFHVSNDAPSNNTLGGAFAGAAAGGLFGATSDAGNKREAPSGIVFGLLLGAFLGGVADSAMTSERRPRQVLTLRYDPSDGQWKVYHGPYLQWAKEALRAE